MKKSTKEPWMPADAYGRSMPPGLSLNLLVTDVPRSIGFHRTVFGANVVYDDPDIAVLRIIAGGATIEFMLHADHTYGDHPLTGAIDGVEARGAGAEFRLHGIDPDQAEAAARAADHIVLAGSMDKPHGMREAYILDPDGYVWVPDRPL
ncbi:MAG: VOC family protein [Pseudomonadota bacterium]